MDQVSKETWVAFEGRLDRAGVPTPERPEYHKWVRFYLHFCTKYGHGPALPASLGPFLAKLASKNQSVSQRSQATAAVRLLQQAGAEPSATFDPTSRQSQVQADQPSTASPPRRHRRSRSGEIPSHPGLNPRPRWCPGLPHRIAP